MACVSVIVPIYNVEKYLRKCLESIINQTLENIEIILVDDGSTDNSGNIADEYALMDSRIVVIHKENNGQGSARNEGLKIAKGEYIGFVDSDDWIDLNMYEKLYSNSDNGKVDILVCSRKTYSDSHKLLNNILVGNEEFYINENTIYEYLTKKLFYPHTVVSYNRIFKRNLVIKNKIIFLDVDEVGSEDTIFNLKCLKNCKRIKTINDVYYNQLARDGSTMRSYKPGYMIRLGNLLGKFSDNYVRSILLIYFYNRYLQIIRKYSDDTKKDIISELKGAMENENFKISVKNILFEKRNNNVMRKMGYKVKGIIFTKIRFMLIHFKLYKLLAIIEVNL